MDATEALSTSEEAAAAASHGHRASHAKAVTIQKGGTTESEEVATDPDNLRADGAASSSVSLHDQPPHIVLVYIDDQGYNDMGPASTDMSDMTPNINRLREDGIWLSK